MIIFARPQKTITVRTIYYNMERSKEETELLKQQIKLTRLFHKACSEYGLIEDGDSILVGLSGGKDSLALVEFLGERSKIYVPRFKVCAVHISIDNIGYSSDLEYLRRFCELHNVSFIHRTSHFSETEGSKKSHCFLCSWYRRKALFETAQETGCNKIALGHHQDDIIETLLMNLIFQGSFSTIAPKLTMTKFPITMIRPLCLMEEKEIAAYAAMQGYHKQAKLCPFEKESSRSGIKELVSQLETFNPNVRDSIWGAMSNIKEEYLPLK